MRRSFVAFLLALPLWSQAVPPGVAVMLDNAEVLRIRSAPPPLTIEQRVNEIEERLQEMAEDTRITPNDIHAVHTELYSGIFGQNRMIMAVFKEDSTTAGVPREKVAAEYIKQIQTALKRYRERRAWASHIKSGILLLLCWSLFLAVVFGHGSMIEWLRRRFRASLDKFEGTGTRRTTVTLLSWSAAWALTSLRLVILIVLLSLFLGLISFSLEEFPATESLAFQARGYIAKPAYQIAEAVVAYLPNFVVLLLLIGALYYVHRMVRAFFWAIEHGELYLPAFHQDWASPTRSIVSLLLVAFGLVVAYPYLPGSHTEAFKGVSLFFGVLISIGSGSSVGNAIAGVILTYMRPFRVGDWVKISDETGDVIERSILITRIRTSKNEEVTLPNSLVLSSKIVNYSGLATSAPVIFHTTITIGYDADWRKVHQALLTAARGTTFVLEDPAPFVLQTSLNDFHVSYQINCYTVKPHEMAKIYSELHERIQDSFNTAGIEIMSPTFYALRDGNTVTIPEAHRPPGYVPPSFRVKNTGAPSQPAPE
jgi:small-conductance mechanosensitive channel